MHKFGQRVTVGIAAAALGSAAFAGTALACEHHATHWHHNGGSAVNGDGGNGGGGGNANANCAVPVGISAGVIGQGGDIKQCNASGGAGGNGGGGVSY